MLNADTQNLVFSSNHSSCSVTAFLLLLLPSPSSTPPTPFATTQLLYYVFCCALSTCPVITMKSIIPSKNHPTCIPTLHP